MSYILSNKKVRSLVSLSPFIALTTTCFVTTGYYYGAINNPLVLDMISFFIGQSVLSLFPLAYMVYFYKFCFYSKLSVWGLLLFNLINILDVILEFFGVTWDYALFFMMVSSGSFLICSIYFLVNNGKD